MSNKSSNVPSEKESLKLAKKNKNAKGESLTQESRQKVKSKERSSKDETVDAENRPNPDYEVSDENLEKDEEDLENLGKDSDEEEDPESILGISKEVLESSSYSFEELNDLKERMVDSPGDYHKIIETLTMAWIREFQRSGHQISYLW